MEKGEEKRGSKNILCPLRKSSDGTAQAILWL